MKFTDEQLRFISTGAEVVDETTCMRLAEEVLKLRKGSLIARGYQINMLQNQLFKQRQRAAGLRRQRDLLLDYISESFPVYNSHLAEEYREAHSAIKALLLRKEAASSHCCESQVS